MTEKNQNLASIGARLLGGLIDLIIVLSVAFFAMFIFFRIFPIEGYYTYAQVEAMNRGRGALIGLLVDALYTVILQSSLRQATLGQRIVGVKLQRADGSRVTFGIALGRWAMSCISSILLKIGFLIAFFTKNKQTLHDLVAGTIVINNETSLKEQTYQTPNRNESNIVIGSNNQSSKQSMEDAYAQWSEPKNNPVINVQKNTANSFNEGETDYWEMASDEWEGGNRKKGLWAKCFSESDGDENKAKAKYLKLRVIELKSGNTDEIKIIQNQATLTTISCPMCHTTNLRARDNCVSCNYNLRELTKVFGR